MPVHIKSKLPKCRIIPKLDIKDDSLVKGINLEGLRVLGSPASFAKKYYDEGADEIIYQDVVASLYGKNTLLDLVEKTAKNIFIPLTVGGGISSIEEIRKLLNAGADKISINSAAVHNPKFIKKAAENFGSSTISLAVDVNKIDNEYLVFTESGRNCSNLKALDWIEQVQNFGAGEIILTSISKEGLGQGFDIELLNKIKKKIKVPLVLNGGAGKIEDIRDILANFELSGIAIGSAFHYFYLEKLKNKNDSTFGNKDYFFGLRDNSNYNSFSIPSVKHII